MKKSYAEWMNDVDQACWKLAGCSAHDLADYCYRVATSRGQKRRGQPTRRRPGAACKLAHVCEFFPAWRARGLDSLIAQAEVLPIRLSLIAQAWQNAIKRRAIRPLNHLRSFDVEKVARPAVFPDQGNLGFGPILVLHLGKYL